MVTFEKSNKDEFEKFITYYLHQKILKQKLIITRKLKQFSKKIDLWIQNYNQQKVKSSGTYFSRILFNIA